MFGFPCGKNIVGLSAFSLDDAEARGRKSAAVRRFVVCA
jgi:hypothetical protein